MRAFDLKSLLVLVAVLLPISAQSRPASEYLDPATGQKCVSETDGPQDSKKYGYFYFKNICGRPFSIHITFTNGVSRSNGVGAGTTGHPSTTHLNCEKAKGECQGANWEVR